MALIYFPIKYYVFKFYFIKFDFHFKMYAPYAGLHQVHGLIVCGMKINTEFRNCLLIYSSDSHAC